MPEQGEQTTLGRLGGIEPVEAGRGEKALWLAGDGYRAALFHLGALTRLNELGLLAQLGTVGAVSGGSIVAALLVRRVAWPLHGAYRDWPERVAEPMRAIARRNARARALLRRPLPGTAAEAALEERYARRLADSLDGESDLGPRFVFGASGLTLSGLAAGWEECLEWEIGACPDGSGYSPGLVRETIATVRADLDAYGEAEQAVLENHGYLVADAALRARGLSVAAGIATRAPEPPHPGWMSEERVHEALAASSRRRPVGRLRPRRPRASGRRRQQPISAETTALLSRHRPLLRYDSLESCPADSATTICELARPGRCNSLHRADGTLIAAAAPAEGEPRLELDFLRALSYPSGEPVHRDDYLDECGGSHVGDAISLRRGQDRSDVVYGHARRDREGRLWLQYWFFHYFFDRGWLGVEQHEGDWEMVQLRLDEGGEPVEATFSHGRNSERLRWDQLERAETEDGPVAVVYPARGSHAPHPRAGSFAAPVLADHNDGLGPARRPRLVAIGDDGPPWALWPGRWGSTRRREYFEGDSPRGPREHPEWWQPAELHAEARPWEEGWTPAGGAPPALRLQARREAGLSIVSYEFEEPDGDQGAPVRVAIAPFDEGAEPSECRPFAIEGLRGSIALQLPLGREWRGVRAAATSESGACGETVAAVFARKERAG